MSEINILLVDDEERFLKTTQKLLEKRGYHIETATSGLDALDKIKKAKIQLVILDVKMPEMDGIAVLKRIIHDFPMIEVIMLTGHATVENAVEGVSLGASDYLMKPIDVDDLSEKIESCFSKRQSINAQTIRRKESFSKAGRLVFLGALATLLVPYLLFIPIGYSWLNDTCGGPKTNQSLSLFHSSICGNRHVITLIFAMIILLITIGVWFAVSNLIQRLRIMAEKRDELQFQLFHASKLASIGELATGVAHEINNPLAIVVSRCGIIRDLLNPEFSPELDPRKVNEELDIISQAAFRAKKITRQLIDFGQKKEASLVPCDVNQILDEIIGGLLEHDFKKYKIEIVRQYTPDLPIILLDEVRIKQVFINILTNACEAILESGTIIISTELKNDYLDITISDTGAGIPASQINEIFKPFYTTKKVGEGTGLSLSISLSIVESQGGTIDVQSKEGIGSSFIISLPIYRE
ncbi:response regulator [bacterium]|nr:response regulator [bacterium]